MEQSLFNIGDRVTCINSKGCEDILTEGKSYEVKAMSACRCGRINVHIGKYIDMNKETSWCSFCGHEEETNIRWLYQYRFIKSESNHQLEEQIHESLKGIRIEN